LKEIHLPNFRRPNNPVRREYHYLISEDQVMVAEPLYVSGVDKMSLPNSGRPSHGGITITSGVEEMPLRISEDHLMAVEPYI
jgi:hypothetical protein